MRPRDIPYPLDVDYFPGIAFRKEFVEEWQHAAVVAYEHYFGQRRPLLHPHGTEFDSATLRFRRRIATNNGLELLKRKFRPRAARGKLVAIVARGRIGRPRAGTTVRDFLPP